MFKKILAVVAVMSTAACLSVSAFAEGETATHENGAVSVNGYTVVENATQYTVMIFENSFTGTEVDKIYYINQGPDLGSLVTGMLVKATTLDDGTTSNELPVGTYTVRIGNDAGESVDIALEVEEDVVIVYGDANGDGTLNKADLLHLAKYYGRVPGITIDQTASNCNGDTILNKADLLHLAKYFGRVPGIVLGPQS